MTAPGCIQFATSRAQREGWDEETDLVVIGSGGAGMTGAVIATAEGSSVILLEVRDEVGGTTARSGGGTWIPNNRFMRARGQQDPREDAIRFMARYSFPQLYDPDDPHLGLSPNAHALIGAFYDNASPGLERLEALGALIMRGDYSYDYWEDAAENAVGYGRTIFPMMAGDREVQGAEYPATPVTPAWREVNRTENGGQIGGGGPLMIGQMKSWLEDHGGRILLDHRAQRLVLNGDGDVVGVEALRGDGSTVSIRARRAVHFGSGGFAFNKEMRLGFLRGPAYGGCAVPTNRGDFVYMATRAGAALGNMQNGWNTSVIMDDAFDEPQPLHPVLLLGGDSMLVINKYGRRVGNEKRNYADRLEVQHDYDPEAREWRNLVLFVLFDQRTIDLCGGFFPFPTREDHPHYVMRGDTIEELSAAIAAKLDKFSHRIGGFGLAPDFTTTLRAEVDRFNGFAESGVDADFGRGTAAYDLQWHARAMGERLVASNDRPNKTMYPLSTEGPFYAVAMLKGHADTNGGPVINAKAQILSSAGEPIPGLYGAGNCIASPSGRAYWGGGTTLGLALTFGCVAGRNAALEPVRAAF
jgi:3-oxosteroid 1-dehydrogenase